MLHRTDRARLDALERTTQALVARLETIEADTLPVAAPAPHSTPPPTRHAPLSAWPPPTTAPVAGAAPPPAPAPAPAPADRPIASLEDLLGGRVLAWTGGLAVLVGIALLLAIAVSNGWIGEGTRTLLAATFSL